MLEKLKKIKDKLLKSNLLKKRELGWLVVSLIFTIIIDILQGSLFRLFILNYLMFLAITSIVFFFKKPKTLYFLISGIVMCLSIASAIIMKFRGTPLTAGDMYSINDGLSIAKKYLGNNLIIIIIITVVIALALLVFSFIKEKKVTDISYKRAIFMFLSTIILSTGLYKFDSKIGMIKTYNWDLAASYKANGFLVSYYKSIRELKPKKPTTYNKTSIDKIKESLEEETVKVNGKVEKPNVIVVQLESFIDPYRFKGINFTEDPIPNIRKLEQEGPHGIMGVPTFGGGTVRTEFEVLTGYSASNLGAGEIPNNTILKKQAVESMATILKDKGYDVTAIHDFEGNFYDRDTTYSSFGFDKFVSMEYIEDITYNGETDYPSDMNNMKPIEEILNNGKNPQFIFNVAVESHGPYLEDYEPKNGQYDFQCDNLTEGEKNQLQDYVDKLKEVDKYVGELVNHVKNSGKPTVIGFYSDHLPALKVIDKPENFNGDEKYKSNYFIWSNTGIKPKEQDIMSYQLSTYILNLAGLEGGIMPTFHKAIAGSENYGEDFKNIQYDQLNGDNYLGADKCEKTKNMKLGLDDIKITNAYIYNGMLVIDGENFTKASAVVVNDKIVSTQYESPNKLIVYDTNINSFKVGQIGRNKKILSTTDEYTLKK
ncbi:LTA synthase family protein [Clostridium massiliamazoniense]|uniref:LTA synthase family protein n=1 Tax=Clostridium massiliamazoniense TaxID=1347366 RepID=UPI0006D852DE|nr:LTA synthase family protein [Clostridium massiliamazoniense]